MNRLRDFLILSVLIIATFEVWACFISIHKNPSFMRNKLNALFETKHKHKTAPGSQYIITYIQPWEGNIIINYQDLPVINMYIVIYYSICRN